MKLEYKRTPYADNDKKIAQLEQTIYTKKNYLVNKQKELEETSKTNVYLKSILDDVKEYNEKIKFEKLQQIQALKLLNDYIYNLRREEKLTEGNMEDARMEQIRIKKEIDDIRTNLDEIDDSVNNINTKI